MNIALPDREIMYQALLDKNSQFEGIFFVGVKTTGIFCRPTCTARKPKKENLEYFSSSREALQYGYRPCKICRPLELTGNIPSWLRPLIDELNTRPDRRMTDGDVRIRGIDPNRVRRWFKKHHGLTFHAFQRLLRISLAFGRIRKGDKVIEAAYDAGYESLSGFTDIFKKSTGFSPNKSSQKKLIFVTRVSTPLGPMLAGALDEKICLLEFIDRRMLEMQVNRLKKLFKAELIPGNQGILDELDEQLRGYFEGELKNFDLPLSLHGTVFQERVWKQLSRIPYGTTRSYKEQAEAIGDVKAVRAVARANGDNRIAIIIPCHRVIGADGQLVGYGGGLWRKKFLLDLETRYRR